MKGRVNHRAVGTSLLGALLFAVAPTAGCGARDNQGPDPQSDFAGTWSCFGDAGDSLNFTVTELGGGQLTASVSIPTGVTCTETFMVSGSTATLIPSLTSCNGPQANNPEVTLSQTSINALTYTSQDEGGPPQTMSCVSER